MARRLIAAAVAAAALVLMTGAVTPASSALASPKSAGIAKELKVQPDYNNQNVLSVNSLAYKDGMPSYAFSLTEVATGRAIPVGYGFASTLGTSDSDFESYYTNLTNEALVVGTEYRAVFHMSTVRFWHCSIYDPDGCSYEPAESVTSYWQFTYTGTINQTVAAYTPASELDLGKKTKAGAHGWRVQVQLTSQDVPIPRAPVTGEYRLASGGGWRVDGTFRTDSHGRLKVHFRGEDRPTQYRFRYGGTADLRGSTSRPLTITAR